MVVPAPRFRLDGFADGSHVLEVVVVLFRLFGSLFPQHADRGRRGVEDIDAQPLGDSPRTSRIGMGGNALVHDARGGDGERAVDDVRMPGDPADIRHAPVSVGRMNVLNVLGGAGDVGKISPGAVLASLGLARAAAGIHQE